MSRRPRRTGEERLRTWTVACIDCETSVDVQVPLQGRQAEIAYLCDPCLEARITDVRDHPEPLKPHRRGRKKRPPPGAESPA